MTQKLRVHLRRIVDNSYTIEIGTSVQKAIQEISKRYPARAKFVITDSNVARIYAPLFDHKNFHLITVPAGEKSKNRNSKARLENEILSLGGERNSLIIAFGGGMVGDLAGFVAATLLRGIPFIQIPTTLLAQVDSSIGGKVGIDHPEGKNLIGAFYQPDHVYIDPATLKTLPDRDFYNGMAEVIKYAVILDKQLFRRLEQEHSHIVNRDRSALTYLIRRCCILKKMIVEQDEKEHGLRRILNFGHTIGHAIESASHYRLRHGEAVALGMIAEAKISTAMGLLPAAEAVRISELITRYHLPTRLPLSLSPNKVTRLTLHDKKMIQGKPRYTLLQSIGKAQIGAIIPDPVVQESLTR